MSRTQLQKCQLLPVFRQAHKVRPRGDTVFRGKNLDRQRLPGQNVSELCPPWRQSLPNQGQPWRLEVFKRVKGIRGQGSPGSPVHHFILWRDFLKKYFRRGQEHFLGRGSGHCTKCGCDEGADQTLAHPASFVNEHSAVHYPSSWKLETFP